MISNFVYLLSILALSRTPKLIELDPIVVESEVAKPSILVLLQMPSSLTSLGKVSATIRFSAAMMARTGLGSVSDYLIVAWALNHKATEDNLSRMEPCEASGAENCDAVDLREAILHAEKAYAKLRPKNPLEPGVLALLWHLYDEHGPAADPARASAALEALLRLETAADVGAWAHFTLGSEARDEGRFQDAHRHLLAGQALDSTLPTGPHWYFDYLLAYTEWALRKPPPTARMEAAIDKARTESLDIVASLEQDLLAFWALEPDKVTAQLTYLETHCGPRAQFLAQELLSIYSELGELDTARQVTQWLTERYPR